MKLDKMIWFNLTVFAFCTFFGIYCICQSNIIIGIVDILLGLLNLYCVFRFIADWWYDSDIVLNKFVFTCPKCGAKQIPSFWEWFFVPHISSMRYLKCQNKECGKHVWMRRK